MDRDTAVAFCREKCLKETTVRHLISVEGVMRALAGRFDEDRDLWGLTGLFHDLDQDHTGDEGLGHAELAASWLREEGVDERIVNGVLAHAYEAYRTDLMSRAVVHADAVAGLLVASALVRPEKAAGMKVSSVKKKLKEKAFAPGCEPRGDRRRRGVDRSAARRLPRGVDRRAPVGRRRDRAGRRRGEG